MGAGPVFYLHHLSQTQLRQGYDVICAVASDLIQPGIGLAAFLTEFEGVRYIHIINRPAIEHDYANPLREAENPQLERLFAQLLDQIQPNLVHFHNLVGLCISLIRVAAEKKLPNIVSLHNYWYICPRDDLFNRHEHRCLGPFISKNCSGCVPVSNRLLLKEDDFQKRAEFSRLMLSKFATRLIAVSQRVKQIYETFGIPSDKIFVQRIGSRCAELLWRQLGRKRRIDKRRIGDKVRFGFIGVIIPRKGVHKILEAVTKLVDCSGKFEVKIYGAAPFADYNERLERYQKEYPILQQHVSFCGPYNQKMLAELLDAVDVAIIPPIWEDTGPQTVMESLAAGLPVIGSRTGGIPDFVEEGKTGLLYEPDDAGLLAEAMRSLILQPERIIKLRKHIKPPKSMEEHVIELGVSYQELLKS
jgi:glycosyltransferase involved in cell wall biosynthesis